MRVPPRSDGGTLEQHLIDARAHVAALKPQIDADPAPLSRRQHAARMRAARQREDRVNQALTRRPELERCKAKQGKLAETARGSTTEAEVTVKKRGDGGFQPAYNTQLTTDTQVIVCVAVTTVGSDLAQLAPIVEHVAARCGETPDMWLVDGGYLAHEQLEVVAEQATVYGPIPKPKDPAADLLAAKPRDSEAVATWRQRMGTDSAQVMYRERAAVPLPWPTI